MASQKPVYIINPHKFTIYDSELSDADSDTDEWVSISTSSSSGTVPNHIALRPRAHNIQSAAKKPAAHPIATNVALISPISTLRLHLPSLKAIYIVKPSSIQPRAHQNLNTNDAFSSLCSIACSPISLHTPTRSECYLRVCGDCVRSRVVLLCDRTWRVDQVGVCGEHAGALREGGDVGTRALRERDRNLFAAVVEAVQPFRRVDGEAERLGVRVFDMVERSGAEGYEHREGCACAEK